MNGTKTCAFADSPRSALSPSYGSNCEASCVVSCPPGWERNGSYCYYWSTGRTSWHKAEEFCVSIGGHLASVPNEQVHKYLQSKDINILGRWVGGIQKEWGNDTWVWSDCSAWNYNPGWGQEPSSSSRNCLRYNNKKDKWDKVYCSFISHDYPKFVCSTQVCSGRKKL